MTMFIQIRWFFPGARKHVRLQLIKLLAIDTQDKDIPTQMMYLDYIHTANTYMYNMRVYHNILFNYIYIYRYVATQQFLGTKWVSFWQVSIRSPSTASFPWWREISMRPGCILLGWIWRGIIPFYGLNSRQLLYSDIVTVDSKPKGMTNVIMVDTDTAPRSKPLRNQIWDAPAIVLLSVVAVNGSSSLVPLPLSQQRFQGGSLAAIA